MDYCSIIQYHFAGKLAENGDYATAAICYGKLGDYKDAKEKCFETWGRVTVRETISAGEYYHTVALKSDGTVVATGYTKYGACDVSDWTDIVAVATGNYHTVGLKSDGTVVATKYIEDEDEYVEKSLLEWDKLLAEFVVIEDNKIVDFISNLKMKESEVEE